MTGHFDTRIVGVFIMTGHFDTRIVGVFIMTGYFDTRIVGVFMMARCFDTPFVGASIARPFCTKCKISGIFDQREADARPLTRQNRKHGRAMRAPTG